ncbi:MAG TPA: DUF4118 domain-containing protein [Actinomycetota bacterium]|nr:DUF4118 domain-containing protein [Actinomycetota bacterium]
MGVPVAAAAGLITLRARTSTVDLAVLSLCAVLAVAAVGSRLAAALAAGSAALSFDYFLTHPYGSLLIRGGQGQVAALAVLVFGLALGQLAASGVGQAGRVELLAVVLVAGLSQALPGPGRWAVRRHGIDIALAVLVSATAAGLPAGAFRAAGKGAGRLGLALAATAVTLPALAWSASRLVAAGALQRGLLALGVAPAEIGSVATVGIGGGDAATAGVLLIGSTVVTVALGPAILSALSRGGTLHPLPVLGNLVLVVAVPMAAGLAARPFTIRPSRAHRAAGSVAFTSLVMLVGLVASEVALTWAYLRVAGAVALLLAGSTVLGGLLGLRAGRPVATGVLLTTSMRDFAVAAAVASTAAGPQAAAPLSLYGVLAVVWGVALASWRRRKT